MDSYHNSRLTSGISVTYSVALEFFVEIWLPLSLSLSLSHTHTHTHTLSLDVSYKLHPAVCVLLSCYFLYFNFHFHLGTAINLQNINFLSIVICPNIYRHTHSISVIYCNLHHEKKEHMTHIHTQCDVFKKNVI
jgi:hypothetical protein